MTDIDKRLDALLAKKAASDQAIEDRKEKDRLKQLENERIRQEVSIALAAKVAVMEKSIANIDEKLKAAGLGLKFVNLPPEGYSVSRHKVIYCKAGEETDLEIEIFVGALGTVETRQRTPGVHGSKLPTGFKLLNLDEKNFSGAIMDWLEKCVR